MSLLKERLKELGWPENEASCFCALVEKGSMDAKALHFETKVPMGRIYDVLDALEQKSAVRLSGRRPRLYHPEHPRRVVEKELDVLTTAVSQAVGEAEGKFEAREGATRAPDAAWVTKGRHGLLVETRAIAEESRDRLCIVAADLSWVMSRDITKLRRLKESNVNVTVIGSENDITTLERLAADEIDARVVEAIDMSFCLCDADLVAVQLGSADTVVVMRDRRVVELYEARYADVRVKSRPVEVPRLAPP